MSPRRSAPAAIRLRGVRHNNLKNFDLDVPLGRLTVITGLSGSGKSSLAFDTLFAEGQRRYIETFSPYARQFFDRMDKPQVDRIEGIPPAIAIEQRNSVRSTRSTVGTMTELCDYLKVLWPHLARLHCRQCGQPVRREPPPAVWEAVQAEAPSGAPPEVLITFNVPLSAKLSLQESLELISRQGYQRILIGSDVVRIDEAAARLAPPPAHVVIVQDRLKLVPARRARFVEACEQAYHFGKGRLALYPVGPDAQPDPRNPRRFSAGFHCATCDLDYQEPTPALFSFNHPVGACPACKGFGRIISIDYDLAIPDRSKSLAGGAVRPWQTGMSAECQVDLAKFCKASRIPMNVPFAQLPQATQDWVIHGDADYDSNDPDHSWPRKWYGVKGYFRWLESKSYKMHVRVLLSRYRAYTTCPECRGRRLKPDALLYTLRAPAGSVTSGPVFSGAVTSIQSPVSRPRFTDSLNTDSLKTEYSLADFYALPVDQALALMESLAGGHALQANDPVGLALGEVRARLRYLVEVGLGYLTLDRPTRTLSGGETERVNLTTCLGTRLVNTLFVLDEPSVGLHPRDTAQLVRILEQLRDLGNTIVVVEHEASVMRAADQVVDLGPGQGEKGGHIVFCGPVRDLLTSAVSLTGAYLSGRKRIEIPARRPVRLGASPVLALKEAAVPYRASAPVSSIQSPAPGIRTDSLNTEHCLHLTHATRHNLKNLSVAIPLGRFVAITGVSGSGKTTLVREVLLPALESNLKSQSSDSMSQAPAKASDRLETSDSSETPESGPRTPDSAALTGWESLSQVVLVDQSALGKTPRSNPVVYIGAFDDVRELFARTDLAKQRGLAASAFSFNSGIGQCERCRGAGFEKIEMQFLSDIFIRCPECHGRRYRAHILEVKLPGLVCKSVIRRPVISPQPGSALRQRGNPRSQTADSRTTDSLKTDSLVTGHWSIADLLEATVDDALEFLSFHREAPAGRRALARLKLLQEVGLGYLRLGQPINTLSGGESQRLKLVSHLAEAAASDSGAADARGLKPTNTRQAAELWLADRHLAGRGSGRSGRSNLSATTPESNTRAPGFLLEPAARMAAPPAARTLFLFDEPTTGLHFEDVRVLLQVFQRLVEAGHSVVVIEHNLDVIKCADWILDLGPDAGERGGQLVVAGTPEEVAACEASHTGRFLREVLSGATARSASLISRQPVGK